LKNLTVMINSIKKTKCITSLAKIKLHKKTNGNHLKSMFKISLQSNLH